MKSTLAACLLAGLALPAAADTTVGLLLPASGNYAALGQDIEDGFRMALSGSGRNDITVIEADTEAKPQTGLTATRKLILQDQADVLVGIVSSAVLAAVRDTVDGAGVPLIVANAGNDEATGADCSPFITRVSFSNSQLNRPMGEWMAAQGIKSVYTLAPDYAAGQQMIGAFSKAFKGRRRQGPGRRLHPLRQDRGFRPLSGQGARFGRAGAVCLLWRGRRDQLCPAI